MSNLTSESSNKLYVQQQCKELRETAVKITKAALLTDSKIMRDTVEQEANGLLRLAYCLEWSTWLYNFGQVH